MWRRCYDLLESWLRLGRPNRGCFEGIESGHRTIGHYTGRINISQQPVLCHCLHPSQQESMNLSHDVTKGDREPGAPPFSESSSLPLTGQRPSWSRLQSIEETRANRIGREILHQLSVKGGGIG